MYNIQEKKMLYSATSNFLGSPPHTVTAMCAATRFIISIPFDSLTGTPFYIMYTGQISKMAEKNDEGLPKHSHFESSAALEQLVCSKCLSIFEAYTTISELLSLQDYIKPSILHVSIAKEASSQDGVVAKTMGEDIQNSAPWETKRIAQTMGDKHNSYNYGIAPVKVDELDANATVKKFNASELFVTSNARITSFYQQVSTRTGQKFVFKPRIDLMVPEFDREVLCCVGCSIAGCTER